MYPQNMIEPPKRLAHQFLGQILDDVAQSNVHQRYLAEDIRLEKLSTGFDDFESQSQIKGIILPNGSTQD
ncbi:unnamed protein product [Ceratitis capitata]|uniref:(Mediterranean fruit fly) hypothetical protein n=1 Tax=Ceratitis capitata TaxID=7213 RepID=A0A811USD5_CERCA|nr:unnamed protein product [Ceratitis capitata]